MWKGAWNYYGYGEDGLFGPTSPPDVPRDVVTLAMYDEFLMDGNPYGIQPDQGS